MSATETQGRLAHRVTAFKFQSGQRPTSSPQGLVPKLVPNLPLYPAHLLQTTEKAFALVPVDPGPQDLFALLMEQADIREDDLPVLAFYCRAHSNPFPGQEGPGSAKAAGEELGLR